MSKYHVNDTTGDMGICTADKKPCPYREEAAHFTDKASATSYSETVLAEQYSAVATLQKKKTAESINPKVNENYPHPEAHRLEKVDVALHAMSRDDLSTANLSSLIGVTERGAIYYGDAASYLGLAEAVKIDGKKGYALTKEGKDYVTLETEDREKVLSKVIDSANITQALKTGGLEKAKKYAMETKNDSYLNADRKVKSLESWVNQTEGSFLYDLDREKVAKSAEEFREMYAQSARSFEKKNEKRGEVCNTCFMEKSLTGTCNNCDD